LGIVCSKVTQANDAPVAQIDNISARIHIVAGEAETP
jgi:hypothetical protein